MSTVAKAEFEPERWSIHPRRAGVLAAAQEVWAYRRFTWFLTYRLVTQMYSGLVLGWFWAVFRPLFPVLVGAVIFGGLLGVPSDDVPYFLFFLAGSAVWRVFARGLLFTTRGLDLHRGLVKKVYFPRVVLPAVTLSPVLIDLAIFLLLLAGAFVYYYQVNGVLYLAFGVNLLYSLLALALTLTFAIGIGYFTSIWQMYARDVRYTVRYITRMWVFLTPVVYPLSMIPEDYRFLATLNPLTPILEAFKWGLFGVGTFERESLLLSASTILAVLVLGVWYFSVHESNAIDRN